MAGVSVKEGYASVLQRIEASCARRSPDMQWTPRLLAVSKTKPYEMIIECYEAGQRNFGENYVQELIDKATNDEILDQCKDIKWHFIGHLQSNKMNKVLAVPNLYMVETVHSEVLAAGLNKNWPKFCDTGRRLKVMIQINTSREAGKSGIHPEEVTSMTKYILEECPNLELDGLMTIGQYYYDCKNGPNPDFLKLIKCRDQVCEALSIDTSKLHVSMGMSCDYEQAIELGSTHVRVGTAIFGYRPKKSLC